MEHIVEDVDLSEATSRWIPAAHPARLVNKPQPACLQSKTQGVLDHERHHGHGEDRGGQVPPDSASGISQPDRGIAASWHQSDQSVQSCRGQPPSWILGFGPVEAAHEHEAVAGWGRRNS